MNPHQLRRLKLKTPPEVKRAASIKAYLALLKPSNSGEGSERKLWINNSRIHRMSFMISLSFSFRNGSPRAGIRLTRRWISGTTPYTCWAPSASYCSISSGSDMHPIQSRLSHMSNMFLQTSKTHRLRRYRITKKVKITHADFSFHLGLLESCETL